MKTWLRPNNRTLACKFFECWNDIRDGTITSRPVLVYRTFGHIDAPIFWNPLTKIQYQTSRQLNQSKFFKLHILKFKVAMDEKITNIKIPKLDIKTIRRGGLTNRLWKHCMFFFDRKHITLFNGLLKTYIQHSQSCFITHNFHMIVPDIDKNVKRDYWGNNNFNNPLVLPLFD